MCSKKSLCFLLLFLFILSAFLNGFSQDFTITDVLSTPYPRGLVSAKETDVIAWIANDEGVRNIWIAKAPDFNPIQITSYKQDDGQPLSHLNLTADGSILVYVRGGNANRDGEHPNPTSNPEGAEQSVYAVETDGESAPLKLGKGSSPVISPLGKRLLLKHKNKIYLVELKSMSTDSIPDPELIINIRGKNGNVKWSPNGQKVAFVSDRDDHSFIGIYDFEKNEISWISPDVDRDMLPVWSPDGNRIAFIRVPGKKKNQLYNFTGGRPFSIWVADVSTGSAEEMWHSPADDGGFAQYYPAHPLRWTQNNRILFYSEHEGWMHIYSITPAGEKLKDLTPGNCEAEHSTISPDGKILYYSTNKEDIDRRHIWQVSTAGETPTAVTKGKSIETNPIMLSSGRYLAFRKSTAVYPQQIFIHDLRNDSKKAIFPKQLTPTFPAQDIVTPRQVFFTAADDLTIHGQLFMPKAAKPGEKHPAIIFMHGGPIRQMLLGWHYSGYYAKTYGMNQLLANKGYVVLSVNFRSGIGYGRDFRRAENQGPRGASEYQDIIAAGLFLQKLPEVNPQKIGLWGGSYGGYLTALGLARDSYLFAAGVDLHGVHDWAFRAEEFSPGGGWAIQGQELMDQAYQSSPVADIDLWHSPVLLVHGDDDRNVMFQQTTDLVQRLRARNVHVETLIFPDEVHSFLRHENWIKTYQETADFFDRFLKSDNDKE